MQSIIIQSGVQPSSVTLVVAVQATDGSKLPGHCSGRNWT